MMGETGCGKTSLIRIISELKNNTMKILNIHAGITDQDIIDFMKGKTKDNNINLIGEGNIKKIEINEEEEEKRRRRNKKIKKEKLKKKKKKKIKHKIFKNIKKKKKKNQNKKIKKKIEI